MPPVLRPRKRLHESDDEPVPRKRQAKDIGDECFELFTNLDYWPADHVLYDEMRITLQSHCLALEGLQFVDHEQPRPRARKLVNSMQRNSEALRDKWIAFTTELRGYNNKMLKEAVEFHKIVVRKPTWYKNGNVLGLPYQSLLHNFEEVVIEDAQSFYEYLRLIVPWPSAEGYDNKEDAKETDYAQKVFFLVQLLEKLDQPNANYYHFHALMLLATQAFRPDLWDGAEERHMIKIRDIIKPYYGTYFGGGGYGRDRACTRYWNFASARRELWAVWKSVNCCDGKRFDSGMEDGDDCWHVSCRFLLETVQKHARAEVRRNVLLAVGRRLPAELTEQIFEQTMLAEECPLTWHICWLNLGEDMTYCGNRDPQCSLRQGARATWCVCIREKREKREEQERAALTKRLRLQGTWSGGRYQPL